MADEEVEEECSEKKESRVDLRCCRYHWLGDFEQAQEKECLSKQVLREDSVDVKNNQVCIG